ncbi:tropomyosin-like [Bolinopsis microptera]|uniref:tropomyosin-like n=1 Tax=Bolinopsis microptera TaxID=2820187 RepID=UPI003078D225
MAAEILKKKIQDLMAERDEALEKGDGLENDLNEMKEELLKAEFEKKELERRFRLTEDELDNQSQVRNDLKKKSINLTVEDERIKDDMKSQVQSINEMEELIQLIDRRYEELELDYNETMEDLNAL